LFSPVSEKFVFRFFENNRFFNSQKFCEKNSEIISCFWVKKFGKSLEKVGKSLETAFSEHSEFTEISEIVLFQTFQKLQKK